MRKLLLLLPLVSGYGQAVEFDVSGVIDVTYEMARSGGDSVDRMTGGGLSSNRVQFKAEQEVNEDIQLKAVYEAKYNPHSDDDIGKREVYAQVISKRWGTLSVGQQDTPSANSYGYADPLYGNDYSLVNNVSVFYAPWREDHSLMYISPRFAGYQFRGMATQASASDGVEHEGEDDGSRDGQVYSVSVDYWADSPWYFAAALDRKYQRNLRDKHHMEQSTDAYLTAVYSMGKTDLTAIYHRYVGYYAYAPWVDFASNGSDLQLGMRHNFLDKHNVAVSLIYKDDRKDEALSDATGVNLAYIYNYDKNIDLYGVYGYIHHKRDSDVRYPISWNLESPLPDENPAGLQLGMRVKF